MGCKMSEVRILSSRPDRKRPAEKQVFFVSVWRAQDLKLRKGGSTTSNRRDAGIAGFAQAKIAPVRLSENDANPLVPTEKKKTC